MFLDGGEFDIEEGDDDMQYVSDINNDATHAEPIPDRKPVGASSQRPPPAAKKTVAKQGSAVNAQAAAALAVYGTGQGKGNRGSSVKKK